MHPFCRALHITGGVGMCHAAGFRLQPEFEEEHTMTPETPRPSPLGRSLAAVILGLTLSAGSQAAHHREAPLTALDQKTDITDFFAFVT